MLHGCEAWFLIKEGTQVKSIAKQDPEENIWAQEGCEWEVKKTPQ